MYPHTIVEATCTSNLTLAFEHSLLGRLRHYRVASQLNPVT